MSSRASIRHVFRCVLSRHGRQHECFAKINQAKWIWVPDFYDTSDDANFVLFRKTLNIDTVPSGRQFIRLSADTPYGLPINGQHASYVPAKSYLTRWHYEEVGVQPFLRPGENVIAVKVLRFSFANAGNSSMVHGSILGLVFQGVIGVNCTSPLLFLPPETGQWLLPFIANSSAEPGNRKYRIMACSSG